MCFGKRAVADDNNHSQNVRPASHSKSATASAKVPSNIDTYEAPVGAPPSQMKNDEYCPPAGPPPSQHDWQNAVPDTSLLPPPPTMGNDRSPTNNATADQAERGLRWTRAHPLTKAGAATVSQPREHKLSMPPSLPPARQLAPGHFAITSARGTSDCCIVEEWPIYLANTHSPIRTGKTKTIYFEVSIHRKALEEVDLGLGFVALPYPPFRLPGWDRGSVGVHGDDGNRYVNDRWGGKDFTQPFRPGQTVGIGMIFSVRESELPPAYNDNPEAAQIDVEVFFTRDGKREGGWNLHEATDANQDMSKVGLEGLHDLYVAVGVFHENNFEIKLDPKLWLYRPGA